MKAPGFPFPEPVSFKEWSIIYPTEKLKIEIFFPERIHYILTTGINCDFCNCQFDHEYTRPGHIQQDNQSRGLFDLCVLAT
ncbi:MAG: hypothetical protein U9Q68_06625, partial [Euryarchaeota archaeon]|nr:hypothetical protein [Euryarchaeota archaeon]